MTVYHYRAFEINPLDCGGEEHLCQREYTSAHEAVLACFDPELRLDYLEIWSPDDTQLGDVSPYAVWGTRETFEQALTAHGGTDLDQTTRELLLATLAL